MIGIKEIVISTFLLFPSSQIGNIDKHYEQFIHNISKPNVIHSSEKINKPKEVKKDIEVPNRGDSIREKTFTLTFYTDLPEENGGYTVTCKGKKLRKGMVASNYYKLNTKIRLKKYGTVTVSDTGGSDFDENNRLDVFVPRNKGESDSTYLKRVNNMGKVEVKGYIVK